MSQQQIDLFPRARTFERRPCAKCGREIVVRRPTARGGKSEYVGEGGLCWGCAIEAKHGR